jgi:hypothetical protein
MTNLIGIIGAVGSGKDTIGYYLVSHYNYTNTSFAKKVKDVLAVVFGWDREMLEGASVESRKWREEVDPYWGISPRTAMQRVGTDMFRHHIEPDVWVKAVVREILNSTPDTKYVITDCRFKNEVDAIKKLGGKIIYVERGKLSPWAEDAKAGKPYSDSCGVHISDWNSFALHSEADIIIKNNGTLKELYETIDQALLSQLAT